MPSGSFRMSFFSSEKFKTSLVILYSFIARFGRMFFFMLRVKLLPAIRTNKLLLARDEFHQLWPV